MDMATTMVGMEPESLHLKRACEGDPAAFTALVRLYDPQLRAYAYRLLRDGMLMDDALQNAYLAAFRSIGRFRGDASFKNWMYRIVQNACIDLIRKRRNDVPPLRPARIDGHGRSREVPRESTRR